MKTIMCISGSLRAESKNSIILKKLKNHFKDSISLQLDGSIGLLPHFNPDIEFSNNEYVINFSHHLKSADAILISTPEYAHGIPGSLKNALDWVVGSGELIDKRIGLIFSSASEADFVRVQLIEVLRTMSAVIQEIDCLKISGTDPAPEILDMVERLIYQP